VKPSGLRYELRHETAIGDPFLGRRIHHIALAWLSLIPATWACIVQESLAISWANIGILYPGADRLNSKMELYAAIAAMLIGDVFEANTQATTQSSDQDTYLFLEAGAAPVMHLLQPAWR